MLWEAQTPVCELTPTYKHSGVREEWYIDECP